MTAPDPTPEQAPQERRVPLAQNDNRFRPLLSDWLEMDWFFEIQRSPIGEDMIDYERDLL